MKNIFKNLVIVAAIVGSASLALAKGEGSGGGIVIWPSLYYESVNQNNMSNTTQTDVNTITVYDARLGYKFPMGLFVGGMYDSYNQNDVATPAGGVSTTTVTAGTSYGGSLGFIYDGWFVVGTYLTGGKLSQDNGVPASKVVFTNGTGSQVDFGYHFMVNPHFGVGPMFSMRSLTYTKWQTGVAQIETVLTQNFTLKDTKPYVSLFFIF